MSWIINGLFTRWWICFESLFSWRLAVPGVVVSQLTPFLSVNSPVVYCSCRQTYNVRTTSHRTIQRHHHHPPQWACHWTYQRSQSPSLSSTFLVDVEEKRQNAVSSIRSNVSNPARPKGVGHCNIRISIGNGSHTLNRVYTMYTYACYDRLLSTIDLSIDRCAWGTREWVWPTLHANSCPERTSQTSREEILTRANIEL